MKTQEQLKAEYDKAALILADELEVAEQLPSLPDRVMRTCRSTGNFWCTYKVKGVRGALEVIRNFNNNYYPVVITYQANDGCTYRLPIELMEERQQGMAKVLCAYMLTVTQGEGFGPDAKISFFTRLEDDRVVKIICDIEGPNYIGKYSLMSADIKTRHGKPGYQACAKYYEINRNYTLSALSNGRYAKFGSGSEGAANYSYYFHNVEAVEKVADKFEPLEVSPLEVNPLEVKS